MKMFKMIPALVCLLPAMLMAGEYEGQQRWWKGNTHTHSWWSDGDSPPELIADWYKTHGYHFLVFTDHNILADGELWYNIDNTRRPREQVETAYAKYLEMFGPRWVEVRKAGDGTREVKLKTLDEFRALFEEAGKFILIKGEEISDSYQNHPVHMNGVNLVDLVDPQGGDSMLHTIQNNVDAVYRQSSRYGQPMLVHLNHPNFRYALTAEDFFHIDYEPGAGFFEMFNGHSGVNNYGDEYHESTERMWDIILAKRLGELERTPINGVAVDDAHEYMAWGLGHTNPGRAWIMVRADWLTPNKITEAIKRGDFYNSTGVTLRRLEITDESIELEIEPKAGVEYRIEFVGTMQDADLEAKGLNDSRHDHVGNVEHGHTTVFRYSDDIGKVLKTVSGTKAGYRAGGDEIYVRARIISSRPHPNPFAEGDVEMAWTQPLVIKTNDSQR